MLVVGGAVMLSGCWILEDVDCVLVGGGAVMLAVCDVCWRSSDIGWVC